MRNASASNVLTALKVKVESDAKEDKLNMQASRVPHLINAIFLSWRADCYLPKFKDTTFLGFLI